MTDPLFSVFNTELERDVALMDRLKEKFDITDAKLAQMIGANKSVICEIRNHYRSLQNNEEVKRKPRALTPRQRLYAFNHLGYAWARDAITAIFPDQVREELHKADNDRTKANTEKKGKSSRTTSKQTVTTS